MIFLKFWTNFFAFVYFYLYYLKYILIRPLSFLHPLCTFLPNPPMTPLFSKRAYFLLSLLYIQICTTQWICLCYMHVYSFKDDLQFDNKLSGSCLGDVNSISQQSLDSWVLCLWLSHFEFSFPSVLLCLFIVPMSKSFHSHLQ